MVFSIFGVLQTALGSAPVAATPGATPSLQVAANPCAAKNPCNPCGASNPCGPCGAAAAPVELTTAEAVAVYNCLKGEMKSAYAKSDNKYASVFLNWKTMRNSPMCRGPMANATC